MNTSDFIFPKGADEKLRVQIAPMFGGMGVGDKNGMWPVKKKINMWNASSSSSSL